jgi:hypothetical protein
MMRNFTSLYAAFRVAHHLPVNCFFHCPGEQAAYNAAQQADQL